MTQPILTVVGATGTQGASVIDAALQAGTYKIRAITRNASSPRAEILAVRGVEVVTADLNSEESLIKAFEGSTAIYAITDFFEPFAHGGASHALTVEVAQGKNLANAAAKTETLKHFIWSTLPNGKKISNGKWTVPHFEGKNRIDDHIKSLKGLYEKTTFLWITWYATNFVYPMFTPNLLKTSGKYVQLSPAPPTVPILSIGDSRSNVGIFTNAILAQPSLTHSRYVLAYVEETTTGGLLEQWSKVTGKESVYVQVKDLEEFDQLWPGWGAEMGGMMAFWAEAGDKSWTGEDFITPKELGVEGSKFVGIEGAYAGQDWSGL